MNNSSYKNRGMFLEKLLTDTNTYYLSIDKALIYKKPTPIKVLNVSYPCNKSALIDKAVFENISTLDYNGIYKGKYIEFDAKECKSTTSFPLSNIKSHQLSHIRNVIRHGGIIFLIIYMNKEFYLLKGQTLLDYIELNERKSLPISFIKEAAYKINETYIPSVDYLKVVDKIYLEEKK